MHEANENANVLSRRGYIATQAVLDTSEYYLERYAALWPKITEYLKQEIGSFDIRDNVVHLKIDGVNEDAVGVDVDSGEAER